MNLSSLKRKRLPSSCSSGTALVFLVALLSGTAAPLPSQVAPEFRSLWITRMAWAAKDADSAAIREKIRTIIAGMKEDGFNAVLFQVRGEAETLYPSSIEPWSRLIGGKDPGFDPLAFAIEEAHKNGIEFHAYLNPFPLFAGAKGDKPDNPGHLFYRHGPGAEESWVALDADGAPMVVEYYYLDPGIPQVHEYVRKVILDVVKRYEVDGIHLDRIRYPGHAEYNPLSVKRFHGRGNPERQEKGDWHRAQIDKFVNDLYAEISAEKPKIVLSAAVWGIYNRYNLEDYFGFSSGYHDYYQDSLEWLRLGAMDYLMPMIYWDMNDPKPNYQDLLADFADKSDIRRIVGGQRRFGGEESIAQVKVARQLGAPGTAIFSGGRYPEFRESVYAQAASIPQRPWKTNPETGILLGTVVDESGVPLADAWISISPAVAGIKPSAVFSKTWTSSADGRFAFLKVPPGKTTIRAEYIGAPAPLLQEAVIEAGKTTKVRLQMANTKEAQSQPFFQVASPGEGQKTSREVVHLLGRTLPENKVRVNGDDLPLFRTGAFAKDNIPLRMGENKILVEVRDPEGRSAARTLTVERGERPEASSRRPEPPPRTGEDISNAVKLTRPSEDVLLRGGDLLSIEVRGPSRLKGKVRLGKTLVFDLQERPGADGKGTGVYLVSLRIPDGFSCPATPLGLELSGKSNGKKYRFKEESKARVEVWERHRVRIGETKVNNSSFTYGIHEVRLGGPSLSEVPAGIRFEIIGKEGGRYKARLAENLTGWIQETEVTVLPDGALPPHLYFTSLTVSGNDDYDIVTLPFGEKVVYALSTEIQPANQIYLDLFNSHHAMTWGTRKSTTRNVGYIQCEQVMNDWVRVTIPILSKQNWGFWAEIQENLLRVIIKRPPRISVTAAQPFLGLTIAVEAGHGGERNKGAVGYLGTSERMVNALAAQALQKELESLGAKVVQMRPGDSNPSFDRRRQYAYEAGADLMISLHCNSGGGGNGYLREIGTSTYYKHEHGAVLASLLHEEMLSLGWGDFGVVANFNYNPLRTTRMPAVLIEQAFMNMPRDEARLSDPAYQKMQARAIARGIERFIKQAIGGI